MKSSPSLRVELRASRLAPALLALTTVLALVCVLTRALPWWGLAGLSALVAVFAVQGWRALRRDAGSVLQLHHDGEWTLQRAGQVPLMCRCERAAVLGSLIVLTMRTPERRAMRVVLWPDGADSDVRRQLRVWLRHALGRAGAEGLPNA